ncbi:MAG: N-acetylneuraminate lyase [Clostridia bacterium]|nr:N-acetylneuraminate lyase [Clostridia bacterium]
MIDNEFKGIFTALLTPFDSNGKINEKQLEKLVKFNIEKGVCGFYVCGSTAEAFLMSKEERMQIMDVVKSAAEDRTLIAHIGSLNERDAAEMGHHAKTLGYDAVSSVAPFYYKFSFEEIKNYYFRLADASSLPMLVYHFPAFSGVNMGVGEMAKFLSDDRFMGIKYTSNDFFMMEQCKTAFPEKVLYNGFDEMFLSGLAMGADGGVGSTYNFMADKFVKIRALFGEGRMEEARALQQQANHIITVLCKIGVMQAEKEVLNQLGFDFGVCRNPFGEPTTEEKELIRKEILPNL